MSLANAILPTFGLARLRTCEHTGCDLCTHDVDCRTFSKRDEVIDACFYIMGEDAYGQENPIVTGYEIVFAVKDGKYYTFG